MDVSQQSWEQGQKLGSHLLKAYLKSLRNSEMRCLKRKCSRREGEEEGKVGSKEGMEEGRKGREVGWLQQGYFAACLVGCLPKNWNMLLHISSLMQEFLASQSNPHKIHCSQP